ncbi:HlyD family secretion protein [Sinimarinibacterium sp. CAU 1509]|uniref:HlyD family secretion protein n=1 Tax=Sinimarinibacterium sp. CAU 1509 TaxID=2562283 RepID=UPI0010ACA0D4|nr:HlyD family secretion protein [Sinimarinibacterium sp. CAU 1509]TJY64704.1 HlyD family secretion protein [Sinimarinibacterium sp. CAU 1509]
MSNTPTLHNRRSNRSLRIWLLGIVPVVAVVVAAALYWFGGRYVSTDDAYLKANLVNVSAEVTGTVTRVNVRENQAVHRGEVLLQIDPAPYEVAVQQAEAALTQTRLQIDSLKASYAQKEASLRSAESDLAYQQSHDRRVREMHAKGVVSGSTLDEAEHGLQVAQSHIVEVQHEIAEVRAQLGGNPDIAAEEHPSYQAAMASLNKARLDFERTQVRAPLDGIASKVAELGEYAMPGLPLMSVVASQDLWVEANLKESQLEHVRPGQAVTIEVDAYRSTQWDGIVDSIGQATGAEFSLLPAQNATGNWVKVVQRVPVRIRIMQRGDAPPLRAGMSSEIRIDTESHPPVLARVNNSAVITPTSAAAP